MRRAIAERITSRSYGAFNRNDLDALLPLYHPECAWDWSHFEGWPEEQVLDGPERLGRIWETFREAWRDFHVEASDPGTLATDSWSPAACGRSEAAAAWASKPSGGRLANFATASSLWSRLQ